LPGVPARQECGAAGWADQNGFAINSSDPQTPPPGEDARREQTRMSALRAPAEVEAVAGGVEIAEEAGCFVVFVAVQFGGEAGLVLEIPGCADFVAVDVDRERAAVVESGEAGVDGERAFQVADAAFAGVAVFRLHRLSDCEVLREADADIAVGAELRHGAAEV